MGGRIVSAAAGKCNTPGKVIYSTPKAARLAAVAMLKANLAEQIRTYTCPAGHWHVTSQGFREPAISKNNTRLREKH